jgi:hypothetical protein
MVNVTVASGGTAGSRGSGWLSGAGAPTTNMVNSIDGDFYLDTTNVGYYYGPRTGGAWGTPQPFGNSLNGVPLTNVTATSGPGATNDATQGYSRGSTWINTTNNLVYTCANAATGAAVWVQTLPAGPTNSAVTVTGTPVTGQVLTASSPGAAAWTTSKNYSTGVLSGCMLTPNTATSFNLSAGTGIIADYVTNPASPTVSFVTIPAQVVTLSGAALTRVVSWWVSDANGTITSLPAPPTADQRRTSIQVGVTAFVNNALTDIISNPTYLAQEANQRYDLGSALGVFRSSGAAVTPNGANLQFNLSAGTLFSIGNNYAQDQRNPDVVTTVAETPCSFYQATHVANSEAVATAIDPTRYDVNGVLTAVGGGNGSSTIQRVYLFGTRTAGTQIAVQYGATVYGTLSAAVAAVGAESAFVQNPDFTQGALIAWICTTRVCTSLADTTNCTIVTAGKFASP